MLTRSSRISVDDWMSRKVSDVDFKEAWSQGFVANSTVLQAVWPWVNTQEKTSRISLISVHVLLYYKLYEVSLFFFRPPSTWDRQLEGLPPTAFFWKKAVPAIFFMCLQFFSYSAIFSMCLQFSWKDRAFFRKPAPFLTVTVMFHICSFRKHNETNGHLTGSNK